jgi:hypothetical protein
MRFELMRALKRSRARLARAKGVGSEAPHRKLTRLSPVAVSASAIGPAFAASSSTLVRCPKAARKVQERGRGMTILKLGFAAFFLFALHQFLEANGGPMGAHVITGALAFVIVVVIGLTKESFI